ncbi:hypothetical protein NIES2109_02310 [Nostoc sp. HK-01]|uniref:Uncharacterized protein n=1 Tax=Anabaenopsis circularis NIES-21 TaxID=1085406 RepID=A0A1Z4GLU5_9CYAN|nr:hypothetical protein NIES21_42960 [Anabaenopsis circularis NIES-21]BBD57465.1 hypothetical protein NIES2109_02310 [Nostoc sp. HK-01]
MSQCNSLSPRVILEQISKGKFKELVKNTAIKLSFVVF